MIIGVYSTLDTAVCSHYKSTNHARTLLFIWYIRFMRNDSINNPDLKWFVSFAVNFIQYMYLV